MALYEEGKTLLIVGPCALESLDTCRKVADVLQEATERFSGITALFSGSFDKANRSSIHSDRGPGMEKGLEYLAQIKKEYGFPVITDVHESCQAQPVGEVCDALQIPAFLCRQTDLLSACAKTGKCVHVKKGQYMSPFEMKHVVEKLQQSGAKEIWQTDRGTFMGYGNLVVDMRSFPIMKQWSSPVLLDATHCVQLPGALDGKSGGQREFIEPLMKAARGAGAQGFYLEVHPEPASAISDATTQIPVNQFIGLIERVLGEKVSVC